MIQISGYIQGLITSPTNLKNNDKKIQRRDLAVLKDLSNNNNMIITPSDKGNGAVIVDTTQYNNELTKLSDNT